MRLFPKIDGRLDRFDRSGWARWPFDLTAPPPFTGVFTTGFRVYANLGVGDIDYLTPVYSCNPTIHTWTSGVLIYPARHRWGVRTFNAYGEEPNLDRNTFIVLNTAGQDASAHPNVPQGVSATAGAGGKITVGWAYEPTGQGAAPATFRVYGDGGTGTMQYSSASATVTAGAGAAAYAWTSGALVNAKSYKWAVRARTTGGIEDGNTMVVSAAADSQSPAQPASLTAVATR